MGDMNVFGAGLQLVVNLFFIGAALGMGIKFSFELVDFFKRRWMNYFFTRRMRAYMQEHPEEYDDAMYDSDPDLDACTERSKVDVEFTLEDTLDPLEDVQFEGK